MSLVKFINNLFKNKRKEKFKNIMKFAESVLESTESTEKRYSENDFEYNEHPLIDVIRLLGRNIQTEYLTHLLYINEDSNHPNITPNELLFSRMEYLTKDEKMISDIIEKVNTEKDVYLSRDLVLPWPWKRSRLYNCISYIGEGRISGEWKEDTRNHSIELWLPMGIAWVLNGNHSTSVGIIQGKGKITPDYTYDISNLYDYIYCNGNNFIRKEDDTIISPVKNLDFAAIFEIGRMMVNNGISF